MNLTRWQVAIAITKKVNKIKTRVPENYVNWSPTTIFFKHNWIFDFTTISWFIFKTNISDATRFHLLNASGFGQPENCAKCERPHGSFTFRVTQTLSHATQKCWKERPCMQTELNLLSFRNFMVALTYLLWTPKYFSTQ